MKETKRQLSELNTHPVQLRRVVPVVIQFRSLQEPNPEYPGPNPEQILVSLSHTEYDETRKSMYVILGVGLSRSAAGGTVGPTLPYEFRVEMLGEFTPAAGEIPKERFTEWVGRIAPFILFPYMRALLSEITGRCGFRPFDLPLLVLPTRSVLPAESESAAKEGRPEGAGKDLSKKLKKRSKRWPASPTTKPSAKKAPTRKPSP